MALALNANTVDLSQLMPEVFRSSPLLADYMTAISNLMGGIQTDIAGLYSLVNPYTCPTQYLQNLANLVGLQLRTSTYLPANTQQTQLINAIAWYKIKGTYASIQYLALLLGLNISIQQFWCDNSTDYNSGIFVPESYFVDLTGTSYPPNLSSSYFPSPHFGIYVLLNQVYGTLPSQYLWNDTPYSDLFYFEEQTRPVHLVPHFYLSLVAQSKETGGIVNLPGNVYGNTVNWSYSTSYYDQVFNKTMTASLYSGYAWGANIASAIISGTVSLYSSTGTLLAIDNGSGGWTSVKSGYTFSGTITYTTGAVEVTVTPTLGTSPYITYQQNLYDTSLTYDQSYLTFLNSIKYWQLGTGNVNSINPPTGVGANYIQTPVLSSTSTGVTAVLNQFTTYNTWTVTLPQSIIQSGITEFSLYTSTSFTNANAVFVCYFPSILLTGNESLVITITVLKQ